MIYFSVALVVVAVALAVLHVAEGRSEKRRVGANILVAVLALAVGISTCVTVFRIGDSGARAVWGGEVTQADD